MMMMMMMMMMISGAGSAGIGAVDADVLLPAGADLLRRHLLSRSRFKGQHSGGRRFGPPLRSGRHIAAGNERNPTPHLVYAPFYQLQPINPN